jgi:hypothetical protein
MGCAVLEANGKNRGGRVPLVNALWYGGGKIGGVPVPVRARVPVVGLLGRFLYPRGMRMPRMPRAWQARAIHTIGGGVTTSSREQY